MTRPVSLILGRDNDVLPVLLSIHAVTNPIIVDVTYNEGKMWKGLEYKPLRLDMAYDFPIDIQADFGRLPLANESVDVLVFDPPHLPNHAASAKSSRLWERSYGITASSDYGRSGDNVSGQFAPFLTEARRVLSPQGVVLAKIADLTHNHRYQWQHVDFINAVQSVGMVPCDMVIKGNPSAGKLMSSKWSKVYHVRKAHCYWIVVRKGNSCERRDQ